MCGRRAKGYGRRGIGGRRVIDSHGVEDRCQIKFRRDREVEKELSIRGLRVDEAIPLLERYIDDVWIFGDGRFKIIHGIGKGILKNAVWQFLSNDKRIASFELAPLEEGGDGVTVGKVRM